MAENCMPVHQHESDEPIHEWFNLTYASYLVLPRSVLQSAPIWWQREFVKLLNLLELAHGGHVPERGKYSVILRDGRRFVEDTYRDYDRGRRIVPLMPMEKP